MQTSSIDADTPHRGWLLRILPAVTLVVAATFELTQVLNFSVAPMLCALSLVAFAFFLTPRQLAGWSAVYVLATAGTLWLRSGLWGGSGGNVQAMVATRTLAAAATAVLACLLAKSRQQDLLSRKEIYRLLDQMEIPVITSDSDGWLVHLNPKAAELLGGEAALGRPFFDYFSVVADKGKSIQSYVDLATGTATGPISISLAVGKDRAQAVPATMVRVDIGRRRHVMSLMQEVSATTPDA
jgi:PAS domain-containing protein